MKATKFFLPAIFILLFLSACRRDLPASATDPLPFPLDEYKDFSTSPGDDFWRYCNGAWYDSTPTPESRGVGGLYDQDPVGTEMKRSLFAEDPSLHRYKQLVDELYANSTEARAFLEEWKARYPEPKTKEDFFRTIGRMIMDGLPFFGITLSGGNLDGKIVGMMSPPGQIAKYSFSDLDDSLKPSARWIGEGMGIAAESLYFCDYSVSFLNAGKDAPLSELVLDMERNWAQLYCYVDEELNNSDPESTKTPQYAKDRALALAGYELSHRMAVKYVTPELKQYYLDLIERIREAFRNRLQKLDWMSETTRNNAIDKLDKMLVFVGCPDIWYEDCLPDLSSCKSLIEAVQKLQATTVLLYKHLIGTNDFFSLFMLTIRESQGRPYSSNLTIANSYNALHYNCFFIFPGMMLPPMQRRDISEAHVYGVASMYAHEIIHGFDNEGANYDSYGRVRNWWTVADAMAFNEEQEKLVACYNSLEYDPVNYPGQYSDGRRTLGEDIADLGGFLVTLDAYSKRLTEQGYYGENYDAQLRKYYESYADLWRSKYSDTYIASVLADFHSPCRVRTNGVVMNTDLWYELYNVDRNNMLYLPPERRARIW